MKTVLVTAIGSFSGGVVLERLRRAGYRTAACDIHPKAWVVNAGFADAFRQVPPAADKAAYLRAVQRLCFDEKVDALLPLTDTEIDVLNAERAWFSANGVTLCFSPKAVTALCRDKYRLTQFVRGTGLFETIPTVRLPEFDPKAARFPVVLKPVNGRSSQGVRYIRDPGEWRAEKPDGYIVQPYVAGDIVTADIVRQPDGGRTAVLPRRERLRTANGAGLAVEVFEDAELRARCIRLADALGVVGCVNFEFILDSDGQYRFLECNPRFSGGVEFSVRAGYDCVLNHMRCFEGAEIEREPAIHAMRMARRYEIYETDG